MTHVGDVGTEIAPEVVDDPELAYERWHDYRVDPHGVGLHGLELAPGEVVRLTQEEVEAHPAWGLHGKDADCLRELAEFAGATLDAFRAAKRAA